MVERIEYRKATVALFSIRMATNARRHFVRVDPIPIAPANGYGTSRACPCPFRLPELIEAVATEHAILIVEGEAKVDLLGLACAATCCAGGAKKWEPNIQRIPARRRCRARSRQ